MQFGKISIVMDAPFHKDWKIQIFLKNIETHHPPLLFVKIL